MEEELKRHEVHVEFKMALWKKRIATLSSSLMKMMMTRMIYYTARIAKPYITLLVRTS